MDAYKDYGEKVKGMDSATDPTTAAAIEAIRIGYASIFEASVAKGRSMGGMTRIRAFQGYLEDFRSANVPEIYVHPAIFAYGKDAAK